MPVEEHRRRFKNLGKSDELRRRRAEGSVELRKTRKDENLMKRRNIDLAANENSDTGELSGNESTDKEIPAPKVCLPLEECLVVFKSGDSSRLLDAVESIRRTLSRQTNPAIAAAIESGAVPYLVQCLSAPDPKIQFEAAWALTNISSGTSEQTQFVVSAGAVPHLVALLDSPLFYVADQACWALSNIAGYSAQMRDVVIHHGIVDPLIRLCAKPITVEFMRTVTWTLSNLCRNRNPAPKEETVNKILPVLASLLTHKDVHIVTDACWAIAYLSDTTDDRIDTIIEHGVVPRMVQLMNSSEISHIAPALRCLGNIVTGNDHQTQVVVDSGVLMNILPAVVRSGKNVIIKEAMWLLSNIAAGNHKQLQSIIDANLIPVVLEVIKKCDHKSQYEAVWVLSNFINGGTVEQLNYLLKHVDTLFSVMCDCLRSCEVKMISLVLDAIAHLLSAADKAEQLEKCTIAIEECGGLDKIEDLQSHSNEDIYHKALGLIETYFCAEEDESRNNGLAQVGQNAGFANETMIPDGGFTF